MREATGQVLGPDGKAVISNAVDASTRGTERILSHVLTL
jgi:hypothetical protein